MEMLRVTVTYVNTMRGNGGNVRVTVTYAITMRGNRGNVKSYCDLCEYYER